MSLWADAKYIAGNISRSFSHRPSVVARANHDRNLQNAAFYRGIEAGVRRVMYGPGAETGILRGDWRTSIVPFSTLINQDFKTVCARAEELNRSYAIARRITAYLANVIVGTGIRPYAAIRYANGEQPKSVNDRLISDWERFNNQAIRGGMLETSYYQSQALELQTMIVYGSCLSNVVESRKGSLLPYSFQLLKPTRLDFSKDTVFETNGIYKANGKKIIHGIEVNDYVEPIRFYLENEDSFYSSDRMQLSFIPVEIEQYLGLTWFYPIMCHMFDHSQLFSDKLKQSRIGAKLGVKLGKEDKVSVEGLLQNSPSEGSFLELPFQGIYMGKDKPEPIAITDPISDTFKPLVDMIMSYIALGIGYSYQSFTTDLNGANFAGSRTNTIGDNKTSASLFKKFIDYSQKAKWNKFVEWEVLTGRLQDFGVTPSVYYRDPWYYNQVIWLPMDYQEWVDPLNDQQALILSYKTGQITWKELVARSGKNMSTQIKEIKEEREALIEAGLNHLLPENISASTKTTPAKQDEPAKGNKDE